MGKEQFSDSREKRSDSSELTSHSPAFFSVTGAVQMTLPVERPKTARNHNGLGPVAPAWRAPCGASGGSD